VAILSTLVLVGCAGSDGTPGIPVSSPRGHLDYVEMALTKGQQARLGVPLNFAYPTALVISKPGDSLLIAVRLGVCDQSTKVIDLREGTDGYAVVVDHLEPVAVPPATCAGVETILGLRAAAVATPDPPPDASVRLG
jgi:hypothetical protein